MVRSLAAEGLAQSGAGVRILVGALASEDEVLRSCARIGLAQAKSSVEAGKALFRRFLVAKGQERVELLCALRGHAKDPGMMKTLRAGLRDADPSVRGESLRQLMELEPAAMRAQALRMAGEHDLLLVEQARAAVACALAMCLQDEDLARLLPLCDEPRALVERELKGLPEDRRRLIGNLALAGASKAHEVSQRRTALWLVDMLGAPDQQVDAVRVALADRDPAIVRVGGRLAVRHEVPGVQGRLEELLNHGDERIRAAAMVTLHGLHQGDPRWIDSLLRSLTSSPPGSRTVAIGMLGELRCRDALGKVHQCLDDDDWRVRAAAYAFCGDLPDLSSIPHLIERLGHERGRLAADAMAVLRQLSGRSYDQPEYWSRWWAAVGADFALPASATLAHATAGNRASLGSAVITYHAIPVVSERICFVVDVSRRMGEKFGAGRGTRLAAAQQGLQKVLVSLGPDVAIDIVAFSDHSRSWHGSLRRLDDAAKKSAAEFVADLHPGGDCNLLAGLQAAYRDPEVDTVYLLTDAQITAGEIVDPAQFAAEVSGWNRLRRVTIHTISLGTRSDLLRQLAVDSGGVPVER